MGTRSLTGVRINGTDKIAYNQHDGYLEGAGADILREIFTFRDQHGDTWIAKLKELADQVVMLSEGKEITAAMRAKYGDSAWDKSVSSGKDVYAFLRHDQNTIIQRLKRGVMADCGAKGMAGHDSEYGYLINLDDETLEIYHSVWPRQKPAEGNRYRDLDEALHILQVHPLRELPETLEETDEEDEAA